MENKSFLNRLSHAGRKKYVRIFLVIVLAVFITGVMTVYRKPAFRGRVLDAETAKPVEGAAVAAVYWQDAKRVIPLPRMITASLGGDVGIIEVRETLTDKNGEFSIPPYNTLISPFAREWKTRFVIFRPGYGSFPSYQTSPSSRIIHDQERFFSENFGKEGELRKRSEAEKVTFGVVKLPKMKTWKKRREASFVSVRFPKTEWPLLHEMLRKEVKWLSQNEGWKEVD